MGQFGPPVPDMELIEAHWPPSISPAARYMMARTWRLHPKSVRGSRARCVLADPPDCLAASDTASRSNRLAVTTTVFRRSARTCRLESDHPGQDQATGKDRAQAYRKESQRSEMKWSHPGAVWISPSGSCRLPPLHPVSASPSPLRSSSPAMLFAIGVRIGTSCVYFSEIGRL